VYDAMNELNIPEKLIRMVKSTMSNTQSRVRIQSNLSAPFTTPWGVWQEDVLACLVFNVMLEYVIGTSRIRIRGTIFCKSVQLVAHADDTVIIGRSLASVKETFQLLEVTSKEAGSVVNESKTKYGVTIHTKLQHTRRY
jgi:hypothetical protein